MSITLRSVKGAALTYEELDNNINQLIYSASIEPGVGTNTHNIVLYYTGSTSPLLRPRTATITVPATPASNLQTVTTVGNTTALSITANSFIKDGGTVDQVLLGTGATSPLIFTPGSGTNSIQPNNNLYSSTATGNYSFAISGLSSDARGNYSLVGAGVENTASGNYSVVLGGESNTAGSFATFIGGGESNEVENNSDSSAIIGGTNNIIEYADRSTILGGTNNLVSSSQDNVIIGGSSNEIKEADRATILGGRNNIVSSSHDNSSILAGENVTTTRSDTAFAPSFYASGSLAAPATSLEGVMQLSKRNSPPSNPEEGMIYLDNGTVPTLKIYVNAMGTLEWKTIAYTP